MCQFSYQPLSIFIKNIPNYTHTLFLTISSHILVSKPLYYSFAHRFYSFFHFIRQPFAILSLYASLFTSLVIIHMPQPSRTHSPSFHVLIHSYLSLLSLSLHTTIHLIASLLFRIDLIHRSLLLFLSDI